jgi:hypothetical protein
LTVIRDQIAASIAVKQAVLAEEKLIVRIEKLAADCFRCLQSGGTATFAAYRRRLCRCTASVR